MEVKINQGLIALVEGDITEEETDAIVNAANSRLSGGAGVDGAIHRAGGPSIMAECRKIGGCPTGQAVITTGGNLKAKQVIHTVGPVYQGGTKGEAELLRSAYLSSLKLAAAKGLKSIAFPAISYGGLQLPARRGGPYRAENGQSTTCGRTPISTSSASSCSTAGRTTPLPPSSKSSSKAG